MYGSVWVLESGCDALPCGTCTFWLTMMCFGFNFLVFILCRFNLYQLFVITNSLSTTTPLMATGALAFWPCIKCFNLLSYSTTSLHVNFQSWALPLCPPVCYTTYACSIYHLDAMQATWHNYIDGKQYHLGCVVRSTVGTKTWQLKSQ